MFKTLPLDASNLASIANAGIVGAWMLAPDDEQTRASIMNHFAVIDDLRRLRSRYGAGTVPLSMGALEGLVEAALQAATPDEIRSMTETRQKSGVGAGTILYNSIVGVMDGKPRPLGNQKDLVYPAVSKQKGKDSSQREKYWQTFRPVCALWAAWVFLDDGGNGGAEFPVAPSDLPKFLAIAEEFRRLGETSTPSHRGGGRPLLAAGDAVRLSPEIVQRLPAGTLDMTAAAN